ASCVKFAYEQLSSVLPVSRGAGCSFESREYACALTRNIDNASTVAYIPCSRNAFLVCLRSFAGRVASAPWLLTRHVRRGPCDRAADAFGERNARLVFQQLDRPADIGDVARHLANALGRLDLDAWRHIERLRDQLGQMHQRITMPIGEVERMVDHSPGGQPF